MREQKEGVLLMSSVLKLIKAEGKIIGDIHS